MYHAFRDTDDPTNIARHGLGGENFGKFSTTDLLRIVYMVMFKNLAGEILAGLDKSTKIFHHQNFGLYIYIYGSYFDGLKLGCIYSYFS